MPSYVMDSFSHQSKMIGIATLEDLLAITLSHLPYDIFWHKHLNKMLQLKHLTEGEYNVKLYNVLKEYWKEKHTKEHLSLYKTKDQFFDDFVFKKYDHDWLHELVAVDNTPVYTKVLKDGQEVLVDKSKFDNLWQSYKARMWAEEIAVIALERWVIPSNGKISYLEAWHKSLHKVVTALTKGWASEWIIFNIEEFLTPLRLDSKVWKELNIKENEMDLHELVELVNEKVGKEVFECMDEMIEFLLGDADDISGIEFIKQEGGYEDGGEYCYTVFKIKDQMYKVEYSYYSHYGFNMDYMEVEEVKPVQRMVTFYE